MRFLVQRMGPSAIDLDTLIERCGDSWQSFEHYANVQNVIRFGLRKDRYPAGQYRIYAWPVGGRISDKYTTAYKRVTND